MCRGIRKAATTPPAENKDHQNGSFDFAISQLFKIIQATKAEIAIQAK